MARAGERAMVGAEYLAAVTTSAASLLTATMRETAVGTVAGGVGIESAAFFAESTPADSE